ncbi:MAG: DNA-binding response OmpR family regulator [Sulfurimonas sp.]|jgi:DNA-binding response OmpR family regulator|uniref:response regulator transcription factor n=1 Tax=Sulfurimonas sp. TaxID=2022749 RepID=UPI0039E45005
MADANNIKSYTSKLSVLFAEDHEELRINTTNILKTLFKSVDSYTNGEDALKQYIKYKNDNDSYYDLVLSDIQMPKMDGIELTKNIYERNPSQSIIILSAYDETEYLLKLVNLGIEQFIKKPVDYQELLNVFLNVAKKIAKTEHVANLKETISLSNNVIYDLNSKAIHGNGKNIYLTKFEIFFMELLSSKIGKIYSNDEITLHFAALDENIDSSNIRKLVSKLRKKLPDNSLESIYGIGYKLIKYYEE